MSANSSEFAEAAEFARTSAAEAITWIASTVEQDSLVEGRWMARISGHAFGLAYTIALRFSLTGEEFRLVAEEWLAVIVYGLMDLGVIADDRKKVEEPV